MVGMAILEVRTHPKMLFVPALIQLVLIAAHVGLALAWAPATSNLGIEGALPSWAQLAAHGVIVIAELWYVVLPALRWWNTTFTLTDAAVVTHWGIIERHSREIPLARITSIHTERGLLDRIFRCGTLIFQDAAYTPAGSYTPLTARTTDAPDLGVVFHDVPRVDQVRAAVDEARSAAVAA